MDRFVFLIRGSASEPYEVTIQRDGDILVAYCTCPAGKMGQYCKHRFAILSGETPNVIKGVEDVKRAASLLPGTDVERAWTAVQEAEARVESAKRELSDAKKMLARAMSSESALSARRDRGGGSG